MTLEQFLLFTELAYWNLEDRGTVRADVIGFYFAMSEYYIVGTDESEREGEYSLMDIRYHDEAVERVHETYDEYHDNWPDELQRGYQVGLNLINQVDVNRNS